MQPDTPSPPPAHRRISPLFVLRLLVTTVVFAMALSTVITIVFFGMGILLNGLRMALLEIRLGEYGMLLRSPASCALVELLLLGLSAPVSWWAGRRVFRDGLRLRRAVQAWVRHE